MNQKNLSVLMVSHEMTPTGAVLSLLNLYHGLRERGHSVHMVSLEGGYLASTSKQVDTLTWNQSSSSQIMENDPEMYDVIVANTIVSDVWLDTQYKEFGKIFSDRLLWYIRELPLDLESQGRYLYDNMPRRKKVMQLAQSILFVSHSSKALYEDHYSLPFTSPIVKVLYNAMDPDLNSMLPCKHHATLRNMRAFARKALRIPTINHTVNVSIGKFSRQKGSFGTMKDFLHAGQSNPDSFRHTIFVGDIEKTYWEVLRKQYLASRTEYDGASQIKLHHVGSIMADKAMHQYYTAGNIIVLNSKCEAFGRVIVEAFAHGVVVLAKGCGGPAEIIRHGKTGLLFSTDAELMWYVDYLVNNPGIASSISRRSCDLVDEEFNSRKYLSTMEHILTEVARKASSPA